MHRRGRHDRRIADRVGRRALRSHPRLGRAGARTRARDGGHRRQLDRRGDRAVALCGQGRRHLHAVGRAVLQQAFAGRHLPALSRDRRSRRRADGALQRPRPHRGRHAARDRDAPRAGARHSRHQGSQWRHRTCRGADPQCAAGLLDLFGRRRHRGRADAARRPRPCERDRERRAPRHAGAVHCGARRQCARSRGDPPEAAGAAPGALRRAEPERHQVGAGAARPLRCRAAPADHAAQHRGAGGGRARDA